MPRYFNPSRGPVGYNLSGGRAGVVPGKGTVVIDRHDEGSPSVLALVRKGLLKRIPDPPPPPHPTETAEKQKLKKVVADRPAKPIEKESESAPAPEKPTKKKRATSKSRRKKKE